MPRPLPELQPDFGLLGHSREPFLRLDIDVTTPLFGGGAEAGVPDGDSPVRASSVRGNLRFWWRALYGAACADSAELFRAEAALWGQTSRANDDSARPSAVEVEIAIRARGELKSHTALMEDLRRERIPSVGLAYALFPFQGEAGGRGREPKLPTNMLIGVSFTLVLRWAPHVQADERSTLDRQVRGAV